MISGFNYSLFVAQFHCKHAIISTYKHDQIAKTKVC